MTSESTEMPQEPAVAELEDSATISITVRTPYNAYTQKETKAATMAAACGSLSQSQPHDLAHMRKPH